MPKRLERNSADRRAGGGARAAGVMAAIILAGAAPAAAQDECSLDGEPLSGEVRYYSTGGTYGEALEEAYFKPFEEKCGVEVIPVSSKRTFEQLVQMHEAGHYQYDMGSSLGYEFPLGIEKGIYARLPHNFWDGIEQNMIEQGMSEYGAWNSTFSHVLAYSTNALPEEFGENGWADFWDVEKYPGKRSLNDDPRALVFALLADGVAPEDIYPVDYDRAFAKMDAIRPHILFWWKAGDQPAQGIVNGEIVAASAFNGRVSSRAQAGEPIANTWNQHLFQVGWNVVIEDAPNERNAVALLRFMQNPEGQAKQAEMTQYLGANKAAFELLPPEITEILASAHLDDPHAIYDQDWWTANIEDATERWNKWRAQ
jgi:putative spermidine/putrescine transport system substrate-binding protein